MSNYLNDITELIDRSVYNNMSERQQDVQRKIEAYLKVYKDKPDAIRDIQRILELYEINQLPIYRSIKRRY